MKLLIVGGGAAGFFAAVNFAENFPGNDVTILEKSNKVLSKVKVSGGGRCNVTNIITEPSELVKFYPRGNKELVSAFHQFSSRGTINWFEKHGVNLKVEEDGRVFPVSDDSQTIVDCLYSSAFKAHVNIVTRAGVLNIIHPSTTSNQWQVKTAGTNYTADKLIIASGSNESIWKLLEKIGHKINPPVPSLFTFNLKDERIKNLAGISLKNIELNVDSSQLNAIGDLLITHWGMSGPAVLKLSAWGARELNEKKYTFTLIVNWTGRKFEQVQDELINYRNSFPNKSVIANPVFNLPARLWERIAEASGINAELKWNGVSKLLMKNLAEELSSAKFIVTGKSTFKEEFVTCGGVNLKEVNIKTMESKIHSGLYFAGEVLDVDALTGGFNFQAAWTTAWIASDSMFSSG